MSQYRIPQQTQREDKILGPLTAKQLLYAFITLAGSYLLFSGINFNPIIEYNLIERILITAPFVLLGLAFTFVEINERPFEIFFFATLRYLISPKVRIWQKVITLQTSPSQAKESKEEEKKQEDEQSEEPAAPRVSVADIQRLSTVLDNPEPGTEEEDNRPTTRTLELLSKVEGDAKNQPEPMSVLAKQKQGLFNLNGISRSIQNMFFGSGNTTPEKGKTPKVSTAQDEEESTDQTSPQKPTASTTSSEELPGRLDSLVDQLKQKPTTETPPKPGSSKPPPNLGQVRELSLEDILKQNTKQKEGNTDESQS